MATELIYKLPQSTAQALINYLVEQPYKEVFGLVAAMQRLEPIEPVAQPGVDPNEDKANGKEDAD